MTGLKIVNKNNICYITYQTFPAPTANSLQTVSNIKYLIRNGCDISLVYPLREPQSSSNLSELQKYYLFNEEVRLFGTQHKYPFGKINFFNQFFFHLSHFFWSKKTINEVLKDKKDFDGFITRSDWIFYFLAKKNKKVIFECHQLSKIRKFILKRGLNNSNSKVIFLNDNLLNFFSSYVNEDNSLVLQNGVDLDEFKNIKTKEKEIIFVGNLNRFNEDRGIKFIIEGYRHSSLINSYKLKIIGGPNDVANSLRKEIKNLKEEKNIQITGRLGRSETINSIMQAEIGILTNSSINQHSTLHTSPLKYFEYLAADLKIIGVDFPAHRALPYAENINFFKEDDIDTLIEAFNNLSNKEVNLKDKEEISLNNRAKNIIKFITI